MFLWSNTVKYIEKKGSSSRTGKNNWSERDSHFWADWFIPITAADQGLSKHTDVVCSTIFGWRETAIRLHYCTRAEVASKAEHNPMLDTTLAFFHQEMTFLREQTTTTTFGKNSQKWFHHSHPLFKETKQWAAHNHISTTFLLRPRWPGGSGSVAKEQKISVSFRYITFHIKFNWNEGAFCSLTPPLSSV